VRICFHLAYKSCHEEKLIICMGIYEIITHSTEVEWLQSVTRRCLRPDEAFTLCRNRN